MNYLLQGRFPLRESVSALVVSEKDKPIRLYAMSGAVGLSWGLWEQPVADNDEEWDSGPEAA